MRNTRDYNLDVLRIIASFMVVIIHISSYFWYDYSYNTVSWQIMNFFDSISLIHHSNPYIFQHG